MKYNCILFFIAVWSLIGCAQTSKISEVKNEDDKKISHGLITEKLHEDSALPIQSYLVSAQIKEVIQGEVSICNRPFKEGEVLLTIKDILQTSRGIIYPLNKEQEVLVAGLADLKFVKGELVTLILKEGLCPSMNETVYKIIRIVK